MTDSESSKIKLPDPVEWSVTMAKITEQARQLIGDFAGRHQMDGMLGMGDPMTVQTAFLDFASHMMREPARLVEAQVHLWQEYLTLWQNATRRFMGESVTPLIKPASDDRRFKDASWSENVVFDYIKQSYLLTARWLQENVRKVEGLDEQTVKKVDFYTRQFVDAMAPSNFVMTNPEILRTTFESGGENLLNGLKNLLEDLERGHGQLAISMTDHDAFALGQNIATTPGKIIASTPLMELIQYAPTTETVARRPLLIVPPWINKYYVLDLRPANSLIKWAVDQGHTVFVISWVNPDETLCDKSFEDYMKEGLLAALQQIALATGEPQVNVIGYCLGGTLLASTLAYMAAAGDERIHSATFMATMIDFSEVGEISVFIDEEQLLSLEQRMNRQGYLDGRSMAASFNMLRANDLIWSFVINNYLLGKEPFPFDLLFWNSDSTRLPAAMHSFYLRNMYQKNLLRVPGGITLDNTPIDITKITTPCYIMASREDHISPWRTVYGSTSLLRGPMRFVLAASGHIAGVVNPPAAHKYCHWISSEALTTDPDSWFAAATQVPGSWWPDWQNWVSSHSDGSVPARHPAADLPDAPGSYVLVAAS